MNNGNKEPSDSGRLRSFYEIIDNEDGTADIYLDTGTTFPDDEGDCRFRILKGVEIWDGLEEDVRRRFDDYYQSAKVIML